MVDLGGYVIILVENKDKKIKLYGSPADKSDLEVADEILEVNGKSLSDATHTEVIAHIHKCIRSRTICLRVKRRSGHKLALDLAQSSNVQDAFVIAVEQQARERLEKLSALQKVKPVDIATLSQQFTQEPNRSGSLCETNQDIQKIIEAHPVYVTSVPELSQSLRSLDKACRSSSTSLANQDQLAPASGGKIAQSFESLQAVEEADDMPVGTGSSGNEDDGHGEEFELKQEFDADGSSLINKYNRSSIKNNVAVTRNSELSSSKKAQERNREMAVDVPDTFIGTTKAPPRYPPPAKPTDRPPDLPPKQNPAKLAAAANKAGTLPGKRGKEVVPPQVPVNGQASKKVKGEGDVDVYPDRIKKYQDDIKKRREDEARAAKEQDFLRNSLRGSKKLQALENSRRQEQLIDPSFVNSAFNLDEDRVDTKMPNRVVGSEELLSILRRVNNYVHNNRQQFSDCNTEDFATITSLLADVRFRKLLALHNKVQEIWCVSTPPSPYCADAMDLAQEVINALHETQSSDSTELMDLLSRFEIEGLFCAHDKIAERELTTQLQGDSLLSGNSVDDDEEMMDRSSHFTDNQENQVKIVQIDKTHEPLGATVRNEGDAVIIGRIVTGGAAEKSGLLHEGDEILEVNGVEMRGKSVNDVCDILANMTGTLTMLIIPTTEEITKPVPQKEQRVVHVKAHFDYDPEDDLYIPCRELGIMFQKGDILHVINQEDTNWWQAYREGEEDQSLAGLIPSRLFQQQREAVKQTMVGDINNKEKSKKGKFLCAKKTQRKKKKKALYNVNANEEVDSDEVLTYEEVALYYPRANHKRPIVVIGPPNIGRHELRQKLMQDVDRFAAAVPHTSRPKKEMELDGQDYHFISRPQFESDIQTHRFVEHGEYEKNYYGTSLDAIRTVVNSGKICVLNLHPQSLKILKVSDLKPFVVFVAPPSLEKLRQNRATMGSNLKDDDLKEIIEKAREMEDQYGHYFDMVIVNLDLERTYNQLIQEINILEREPQWVPSTWLKTEIS